MSGNQNETSNLFKRFVGNNSRGTTRRSNQGNASNSGRSSYVPSVALSGGASAIGLFVIVVVISVMLYYIFRTFAKDDKLNPVLIPKPYETDNLGEYKQPLPINGGSLYIGDGVSSSYSVWVYVKDWNSNRQTIFKRGDRPESREENNFTGMEIDYNDNISLVVRSKTKNEPPADGFHFSVPNFPLQKWVHIVYVINGSVIDLYLNGKLRKSVLVNGCGNNNNICTSGDDPIESITVPSPKRGGYSGQISRFNYYSRPLQPNDVVELYNDGPF